MEDFLIQSKQSQELLSTTSTVHVVLGNESCDLDSAVAAIVYAYYLSKKYKKIPVIPVLNIPESEHRLHTETTHFFNKLNIQTDTLTFRNQLNLRSLRAEKKLKLHLVDHNTLTGSDVIFEDCVTTVIDHHVQECKERDGVHVKLDFVGSCCTLVAEELLEDPDFEVDKVVAELLFGTILVDTINRSEAAGKVTLKDQNALDKLHRVIPHVKGDILFLELQTAKFDIGDLMNMEILEKDLKMVHGSGMTIAMSSVTMEMEVLLKRPDFQKDLAELGLKKGADVVVLMTLTTDEDETTSRQIAVFSSNRIYKDQIADVLDNAADDNLELEPSFPPFDSISVFKQGNVKASRKKVMPILKSFLQGDVTPDVTSKEFVTQQSVSIAKEGFSSFSSLIESGPSWEGANEKTPVDLGNDNKLDLDSLDPFGKGANKLNTSENQSQIFLEHGNNDFSMTTDNFDMSEHGDTVSSDTQVNSESQLYDNSFDIFATQNEEDDTLALNVSKSDNPFVDFSSANLSSVNSSNPFDFFNSDSELVDPFSSVEENPCSNLIQTNSTDVADIEPVDIGVSNNQSLLDITASHTDSQTPNTNPFFDVTNDSTQSNLLPVDVEFANMSDYGTSDIGNTNMSEVETNTSGNNSNSLDALVMGKSNVVDSDTQGIPFNVMEVKPGLIDTGLSDQSNSYSENSTEIGWNSSTSDASNTSSSVFSNNPFGKMNDNFCLNNPFSLPVETAVAGESQFDDMTADEHFSGMRYLDIDAQGHKGARPKARKSISLIVEIDQHSEEKLDELNEADFFDKVPTPDLQPHSGEGSPFVNSGENSPFINSRISTPFEDLTIHTPKGVHIQGSGYPSISTPPNSVMEGSGFDSRDHGLPSFNNAEMVERIHKKKASLGHISNFQDETEEPEQNSVPYTPQNSFKDEMPLTNVNLILPQMENTEMEHAIEEKRNSLHAAQEMMLLEEDLLGLGSSANQNHADNDTNLIPASTKDTVILTSQESNNSFDKGISSAQESNNSFGITDNPFGIFTDTQPFTPSNSYVDTVGASYMQARGSVTDTELFDRLSDLKRDRGSEDASDIRIASAEKMSKLDRDDMSNFDPFSNESEIYSVTQSETKAEAFDVQSDLGELCADNLDPTIQDTDTDIRGQTTHVDNLAENEFTNNLGNEIFDLDPFLTTTADTFEEKQDSLSELVKEKCNPFTVPKPNPEVHNKLSLDDHVEPLSEQTDKEKSSEDRISSDAHFESLSRDTDTENGSEDKLSLNAHFKAEMQKTADTDVAQDMSKSVTSELMNNALDLFPDMSNQTLAEHVTMEILQDSGSDWTDQGSGDSGIGSGESPQQAGSSRPQGSPRSPRHVTQYSLETDYLPSIDPLHGNLNIVTTPSETQSVETDADKEVVEGASFRQASIEVGPGHFIEDQPNVLPVVSESSVKDMILSDNIDQSHDCEHQSADIPKQSDPTGITNGFQPQINLLNDTASINDNQSFNLLDNTSTKIDGGSDFIMSDKTILPSYEDDADDVMNLSKSAEVLQETVNEDSITKDSINMMMDEDSITKDSINMMMDEDEQVSSPESPDGNKAEIFNSFTESPDVNEAEIFNSFTECSDVNESEMFIKESAGYGSSFNGHIVPPNELLLDGLDSHSSETHQPVEINIEGCSISPDSSNSYNSSTDSEVDLVTVMENITDTSPTEVMDHLVDSKSETEVMDHLVDSNTETEVIDHLVDSNTETEVIDHLVDSNTETEVIDHLVDSNTETKVIDHLVDSKTETEVIDHLVDSNTETEVIDHLVDSNTETEVIDHLVDSNTETEVIDHLVDSNTETEVIDHLVDSNTQTEGIDHLVESSNETENSPYNNDNEIKTTESLENTAIQTTKSISKDLAEKKDIISFVEDEDKCGDLDNVIRLDGLVPEQDSLTSTMAVEMGDLDHLNLVESTMTIETISPVETPDHEHATGFYEVNPEVKGDIVNMESSLVDTSLGDNETGFYEVNPEAKGDIVNMESSLVDSSLGDNETGFYEVNPDDGTMIQSVLPVASEFSIETPSEDHVTGFYEVNHDRAQNLDDNLPDERENDVSVEEPVGKTPEISVSMTTDIEKENIPEMSISLTESMETEKIPEMSISMTTSTETDYSDFDGHSGFYEMNSEIQGTVLQNIEIGDAFSPVGSPNDEIVGLSYKINPMIPDLPNESSTEVEESDWMDASIFECPVGTKVTSDKDTHTLESDTMIFNMADELVNEAIKTAYEAVQEIQEQEEAEVVKAIAEAMLSDDEQLPESSVSMLLQDKMLEDLSETMLKKDEMLEESDETMFICDETFEESSETMLNKDNILEKSDKSILSDNEKVEKSNEPMLINDETLAETCDTILTDDEKLAESSEDSDISSTTTEGSYRINCSPVMTPESESMIEEHVKRMRSNEVYVIEEEEGMFEETDNTDEDVINVESQTGSVKEIDDSVINDKSHATLFNEVERVEGNPIIEEEALAVTNDTEVLPTFSEEYDLKGQEERGYTEEVNNGDITCMKTLTRQETVIPDIVISNEDNGNVENNKQDYSEEEISKMVRNEDEKEEQPDTCSDKEVVTIDISRSDDTGQEEGVDRCIVHVEKQSTEGSSFGIPTQSRDSESSSEQKTDTEASDVEELHDGKGARHKTSFTNSSMINKPEDSGIDEGKGARHKSSYNNSGMLNKTVNNSSIEESSVSITKSKSAEQDYTTRKEIFYTTAGRMSVSIDSVVDPPGYADHVSHGGCQNPISEETMINETAGKADEILAEISLAKLTNMDDLQEYLVEKYDLDPDTISLCTQSGDDDFGLVDIKDDQQKTTTTDIEQKYIQQDTKSSDRHIPQTGNQETPIKNKQTQNDGKMRGMDDTQEWHEDPIPGLGIQEEEGSSESESESDSDSEYGKPVRPDSLLSGKKRKKKIAANSNLVSNDSTDDLPTPDDLDTPDDMEGELEWEDDTPITPSSEKKFSDYIHTHDGDDDDDDEDREYEQNSRVKKVEIAGKDYKVDMHVIEPYKKVLSHGGYYGDGLNAIILFCGCYLPDRSRRDYQYVMDNLFLYVISTLELLVAEDYMIVYFHGATPRRQMPSFGWLKRCYQMIDRRLRKNLKALLMVHPTLWLKTVVMMTKPFISSKFSSKLRFVKTLQELGKIVPMEYIYVPDQVEQYDTKLKQQRASSSSTTSPVTPISPS